MSPRLPFLASAVTLCAAVMAGTGSALASASAAPASGGTWGTARLIPGLAALNIGGSEKASAVSCAAAGNCAAGGQYRDGAGRYQAYVASEAGGAWRKAREVPGLATLNTGGNAEVDAASCGSAGNCLAGGSYTASGNKYVPFVVSEVNGVWQKARQIPGMAVLQAGIAAFVESISCPSRGNCLVGGFYNAGSAYRTFVASEVNGVWGKARQVPGLAGASEWTYAVSCAPAGDCVIGGKYMSAGGSGAFLANEVNGSWHQAHAVPGLAALGAVRGQLNSVSCASSGNCVAAGSYADSANSGHAFLASEVNGAWTAAIQVPGITTLTSSGDAAIGFGSVSCASAGNCAVGGSYLDSSQVSQAFVLSEVNGVWGTAEELPGSAALNVGGGAGVTAVSCAVAGNCAAGGYYTQLSGAFHPLEAFVASEVNGQWMSAEQVPGTQALNTGGHALVDSVSCGAPGNCAALGIYWDSAVRPNAFIVSES